MLDQIPDLPAVPLGAQEYLDDFWHRSKGGEGDVWKLERIQSFREPDEPSWAAMMDGDWDRALALIEDKRAASKEHVIVTEGVRNRRIRIVEHPITPYLQWEMHILRIWVETGAQDVRVLGPDGVAAFEGGRPLPEVVVMGDRALYQVLYDGSGTHCGGRRIDDPGVIAECRRELAVLFGAAEDLPPFFDREIAPLGAPAVRV